MQCLAHDTCSYDANLTQAAFFRIYDRAVHTLRQAAPRAKVVAPSIADGGPGLFGFERSVFPWLQAFLLHAHAHGTLPDVLSWHVSTVGANASELEGHHAALKAWAQAQGIPLPPIGHNEVIGPPESLDPAANLFFLSNMERLEVEHSCRACWTDPVTKQSPCWDNSLDALLTNDCLKNHSLGPNKGYRPRCDEALQPRSNYRVYETFAELRGAELAPFRADGCSGVLDGIAAVSPASAQGGPMNVTLLLGQASTAAEPIAVRVEGLAPTAAATVQTERIGASGRLAAPAPTASAHTATATASGRLEIDLGAVAPSDVHHVQLAVQAARPAAAPLGARTSPDYRWELAPAPADFSQQAYRNQSTWSWGGSIVFVEEDQHFHMFDEAQTGGCGVSGWQTNGKIVHTRSRRPEGPYHWADDALPVWHTGPHIVRAPDGTFLLWSMGTTNASAERKCVHGVPVGPAAHKTEMRSRLYSSASVSGPWSEVRRCKSPDSTCDIIPPSVNPNPVAQFAPNGSVIVMAGGENTLGDFGIFIADHWRGPYRATHHTLFAEQDYPHEDCSCCPAPPPRPDSCCKPSCFAWSTSCGQDPRGIANTTCHLEDVFFYFDKQRQRWRWLAHQKLAGAGLSGLGRRQCDWFPGVGGFAESLTDDLFGAWEYDFWKPAFGLYSTLSNGTSYCLESRERPKVFTHANRSFLTNSACPSPMGPGDSGCFTWLQEIRGEAAPASKSDDDAARVDVMAFGAKGDGQTDDSKAIVAAVAAAAAKSPCAIDFPAGKTFLTRPFNLSSGLTLQVDGTIRGAVGNNTGRNESVYFFGVPSTRVAHKPPSCPPGSQPAAGVGGRCFGEESWPVIKPLPSYGSDRDIGAPARYQALIMAADARDIVIKGSGTIDGSGPWWWTEHAKKPSSLHVGRPHLIEFYNCSQVEVAGVTLRDSPFWTLHVVYSIDIWIHHLTVRARMYAPNADGIDPDSSKNVLIEHCDISTGDDHIAIKSGLSPAARDPANFPLYQTRNVTVRYCTMRTGMGISIGSETSGGIADVHVHGNRMGLCTSPNNCNLTGCETGLHPRHLSAPATNVLRLNRPTGELPSLRSRDVRLERRPAREDDPLARRDHRKHCLSQQQRLGEQFIHRAVDKLPDRRQAPRGISADRH